MAEIDDKWLADNLEKLRNSKSPSSQQKLIVLLADKPDRAAKEANTLTALVRAERLAERALRARAAAAKHLASEQDRQRKARNHELFNLAGLVSLAGLADKETGKLAMDAAEFLGALIEMRDAPLPDDLRARWRQIGNAALANAAAKKKKQQQQQPLPQPEPEPEPDNAQEIPRKPRFEDIDI